MSLHEEALGTPGIERVAVVGVGYVGLTVLCALGKAGFSAVGYDINVPRTQAIAAGQMPFEGGEPALETLLAELVTAKQITASADPTCLRDARVIFVAVETPVDDGDHHPRYVALKSAVQTLSEQMAPGTLVIIESTIAPGTTHRLVLPALEQATGGKAGEQFNLVHCPERVMPGRLLQNITTYDRVVGGVTPACTARALPIYKRITAGALYPTDALTAEIVKTAENAYRDVQIAFANELALICEELGADVYHVRTLVNSSPFRQMHLPGAGVGGHCIPKDPWLLCSSVSQYQPRLLPTARAVNDGMPLHLVTMVTQALATAERTLADATIAVLGASYLEETDDIRATPALPLLRSLVAQGAKVRVIDPFVPRLEEFSVAPDLSALSGCDAAILVTAHKAFVALDLPACAALMRTPILIDGRNVFTRKQAESTGWRYWGIGKG